MNHGWSLKHLPLECPDTHWLAVKDSVNFFLCSPVGTLAILACRRRTAFSSQIFSLWPPPGDNSSDMAR
jgi:hypothetical protein